MNEDPLTRPDVTWEELGRGFIEQEPDWEGEHDDESNNETSDDFEDYFEEYDQERA